ncbi:hypothetical protein DV737_g865, partial [Chaetothyriales sp. CBS 132003]
MAAARQPASFAVSDLPQHVRTKSSNFNEVSRKLPLDFDLQRDCELLKIIQYTCTTLQMQIEYRQTHAEGAQPQRECFPFTRLFRKCHEGGIGGKHRPFTVETTAWEGEHRWERPVREDETDATTGQTGKTGETGNTGTEAATAKHWPFFWTGR